MSRTQPNPRRLDLPPAYLSVALAAADHAFDQELRNSPAWGAATGYAILDAAQAHDGQHRLEIASVTHSRAWWALAQTLRAFLQSPNYGLRFFTERDRAAWDRKLEVLAEHLAGWRLAPAALQALRAQMLKYQRGHPPRSAHFQIDELLDLLSRSTVSCVLGPEFVTPAAFGGLTSSALRRLIERLARGPELEHLPDPALVVDLQAQLYTTWRRFFVEGP